MDEEVAHGFRVGLGRKAKTPKERFYAQVLPLANGCWRWLGSYKSEYGAFWNGLKQEGAHVFAARVIGGQQTEGRDVDHLCLRPNCVNPERLEAVPHQENVIRGNGPSALNARKTHCSQGHPYDEENTVLRGGKRKCRICERAAGERARRRAGMRPRGR